jgi:uridine phosphorylase
MLGDPHHGINTTCFIMANLCCADDASLGVISPKTNTLSSAVLFHGPSFIFHDGGAGRSGPVNRRRLPAVGEDATNDPQRERGCPEMAANEGGIPPILAQKHYAQPSAFTPENLLREARRQKNIASSAIPEICVLDPDGDILRSLLARGEAHIHPGWACYHTQLHAFSRGGIDFGIVGCAVGASFAVLIAEEMFASGCKLLISVTSSGQIVPICPPPYFIIIDRALRDEGTSYHYMAASDYSHADNRLIAALDGAFENFAVPVLTGATWTTDAPFRETQAAIDAMVKKDLMAVEMEAAALYAFAQVRKKPVLCFAHVTNQMGRVDGDFEKGEADGSRDALELIAIAADRLRSRVLP